MELSIEQDLNAIIKMMPLFGKHGNLVFAYVELFGISPFGKNLKKTRVILEEMKNLIESESFKYQKKVYRISAKGIIEALGIMVHRRFETFLDGHNYLKKIMIGISEREAKGESIEAEKTLRSKEERLMSGRRQQGPPAAAHRDTAQDAENKLRVQKLIKEIG